MATPELHTILITLLCLSQLFSCWLLLLLWRKLSRLPGLTQAQPLAAGIQLPQMQVNTLDGAATLPDQTQALVLLYLSPKCPKCRGLLPQIERLAGQIRQYGEAAGIRLQLVSCEPRWRLRRFLAETALPAHLLLLTRRQYLRLNPSWQSPMYQLIAAGGELQHAGLCGDEQWQLFCEQIASLATEQGIQAA